MCATPLGIRHKLTNETMSVPCSKCPDCIKQRVSGWSFRLNQEIKRAESANFITLTYDTKHVPITSRGFLTVNRRDLQLFFKRLRKAQDKTIKTGSTSEPGLTRPPIKYYAVGEYGEHTWRPHYHVILFNAIIELIQPAWNLGEIHYGDHVGGDTVGYCLKYVSKPKRVPLHQNDDRSREFALMSKGIGDNYVNEENKKWHHADLQNRMYCNAEGGIKIAMPRYYKQKLYEETQRKAVGYATRQRMIQAELKAAAKDPNYYIKKALSVKAAFDKMHRQATLNQTL